MASINVLKNNVMLCFCLNKVLPPSLTSINSRDYDDFCHDYSPILMNWNTSIDCCYWDGVTCNPFTGDVIGLDLSCGMLQGTILHNTSLFHLPHLRRLNLAYNEFYPSQFPHGIAGFYNSLTHLNISGYGFTGQVPSDISFLSKLVSLDLSLNLNLRLESHVLNNLFRNSTDLEELSLEDVNISSVNLPIHLNVSSLKLLDLSFTGMTGKLPDNIFSLPYLEQLNLSYNAFTDQNPLKISSHSKLVSFGFSGNRFPLQIQPPALNNLLQNSTCLRDLWLGGVNIGMVLPPHLNITSLISLDLSYTSLTGKLPYNIFNLLYLEYLDLSGNNGITGSLPSVNSSTISPLKSLYLSSNNLSPGEIPDSIGHLKSLISLGLDSCNLRGSLPNSLVNLRQMTSLSLSNNKLNGTLPTWFFTLQSLREIYLGHNQLDGHIDMLDQGPTLQTFRQLINLTALDISFNNFQGVWELDTLLSILPNLDHLSLSYSGLSVTTNNATHYVAKNVNFTYLELASCKLTVFPESLRTLTNLQYLNLSYNEIHGHIPDWAEEIGRNGLLNSLDLSNNFITSLPQFQWHVLQYLNLKSNLIQGPFPRSICNMRALALLDMSNNSFSGVIPQCFGNIISSLMIVDLGNNNFHGIIPNVYKDCEWLEGLILNGNQFEGEVPSSLSKCLSLKILNLQNNSFNGTFPRWLQSLPNLQVLDLRSNNFQGPVVAFSQAKLPFPSLRVLDLSNNGFVGHLPQIYFENFNGMIKNRVRMGLEPQYMRSRYMYYSIIVVMKGVEQYFQQILVDFTIVDLSNNNFEGKILDVIGYLNSLKVLNLSHNNLTGRIPHALGNLSEIESLDLSFNQLTGEIPQILADCLTFLEVLNVSHNHLIGHIPLGKQFNTFEGNSFGGNEELCGLPLSKKCEHPHKPPSRADEVDDESGFTWRPVVLGYGCGTLLGMVLGYLMLSTGKPRWFNAIVDGVEYMICAR